MDNLEPLKHVLDGANPNMVEALILVREEHPHWMMAGAQGMSHLTAPFPPHMRLDMCKLWLILFKGTDVT
jgi:hypothetical protein